VRTGLTAALYAFALTAGACALKGPVDTTGGAGGGTTTHAAHSSDASSALATSASTGDYTPDLPPSFSVVGRVVDQDGQPLAGAIVLQGGRSHEPTIASAADGSFTLAMKFTGLGIPAIVASKLGYRSAGEELFSVPEAPLELVLHAANPPDNEGYVYGKPGQGNDPTTAYCGHCHVSIAAEFQTSGHARATRAPLLQHRYAGTTAAATTESACLAKGGRWLVGRVPGTASEAAAKCYLGGGVLTDLNPQCGGSGGLACDDPALPQAQRPTAFGGCADCHSPGMDGKAGGRDLHEAVGVAYDNGVHCDFCHKVADVDLEKPAGTGGRLRVQRPSETIANGPPSSKLRQVMFGPLLDVPNPNMGGSVQPKFATAELCAGCHEHRQAALVPGTTLAARHASGLPIHTTYSEWLEGPYGKAEIPCQHCHMPANVELESAADLGTEETSSITYGFPRPAEQIRRHTFQGPLAKPSPQTPRLLDTALAQSLAGTLGDGSLDVTVEVSNIGCGHAVPTGEPMRSVLLLVEADCAGTKLASLGGMTLDEVGGARARGIVGAGLTIGTQALTWPLAAKLAKPGDVVRLVRPTGEHHDYDGVGLFAGAQLPASEKGMPVLAWVGEAQVLDVAGDVLVLDRSLPSQGGDVAYLGDALATVEGQPSLALAGAPGLTFARVLVDPLATVQVPHHRAVDLLRDNRLRPTKVERATFRFALAPPCSGKVAAVKSTLLYRPVPLAEGHLRGVTATDHRIGTSILAVTLP